MKALSYRILLRKEAEKGYTVIVPSLPGCVTFGDTIEEGIEMAKEAIQLYIESLTEHNEEIPTEEGMFEYNLTVDDNKDLPKGTFLEILKQAGIDKEELEDF